jgi:hypothetical protein
MPAFGRDQMLPRADILKVVSYVYSLSHPGAIARDSAAARAALPATALPASPAADTSSTR